MTDTRKSDGGWAYFVATTLLQFAPLSAFLIANQYPIASAEVGILLAACAAAGAALGLVVQLGATTAGALLLGAVTALSIDLMYDLRFSKLLLLLVPVICLALAWILRRHIALILSVASFVLLATTLLIPAKTAAGLVPVTYEGKSGTQINQNDLPVILHLILDEHIGIDGLPKELADSAEFGRWLTDFYLQRGFRIYTGAYSEYFDTRNSIPNLLNFTSHDHDSSHLVEGKSRPYHLRDSAYFQHLSKLGYRLHVYQSDYMDYCQVPGVSYSSCTSYSGHKIGSLYRTTLGTSARAEFIFNSLVANSTYLNRTRRIYERLRRSLQEVPLPAWGRGTSRVGPIPVLPIFKQLENDLRTSSRGNAYFAHLMIPHYPYVLDASCRLREEIKDWLYSAPIPPEEVQDWLISELVRHALTTRAERYQKYFEQIRCQQTLLDELFNAMKQAGVWGDATVIVHGDHGSRIVRQLLVAENAGSLMPEDLRDAFSTLFVIRTAGQDGGVLREIQPLQHLLGKAFEMPMDDSPPKVYLRANDGTLKPRSFAGF